MKFKSLITTLTLIGTTAIANCVMADEYVIDTKGSHASINFKIAHLGYSYVMGRFNTFSGSFSYDEANPAASSAKVTIKTESIDSNHAERDKHLRSDDFFDVKQYPFAEFTSTSYQVTDEDNQKGVLKGDLTLHGVTRPISLDVEHIGAGPDPWGGYRRGFSAKTRVKLKDFNIDYNLGPASEEAELSIHVEGIKQ